MNRLSLSTLLLSLTVGLTSVSAQPTIYAYRAWQKDLPKTYVAGPVKFNAGDPTNLTLIDNQTGMGDINAGAYYNYKWYGDVTQPGSQSRLQGLYTLDMETGKRTLISKKGVQMAEMSYDYSTNTMYGIKVNNEYLMTINLETGEVQELGYFRDDSWYSKVILAMAVDLKGQMYGVGMDNMFYKIDKTTATCTLIGDTGVDAAYTQDMEFDHNSGILYWCNNGDNRFYTIDVTTGKATLVGKAGKYGDALTAFAIPYVNVAKGAPDRVLGRKIGLFNNTANTVELKWILPEVDAQGAKLTELKGVKIYRNNELLYTDDFGVNADKMPGLMQNYYDKDLKDGLYEYKIVPFNAAGDGGADTDPLVMYIGSNPPASVTNLKVVPGDGVATLTWTAPTAGLYGGEFDPASITKYKVTRIEAAAEKVFYTEGAVTTYTDALKFGKVKYKVEAVNAAGIGSATESAEVLVKPSNWIIIGQDKAEIETGKEYMFYDVGGPDGNYMNERRDSVIIVPKSKSGVVKVEFTKFSTDSYDSFEVYHGSDKNAVKYGAFAGSSIPAELVSFESLAKDGSLKFVFVTDAIFDDEGWEAKVTAYEKKSYDLEMKLFNGTGFPTEGQKTTYSVTVMNKGVETMKAADYKITVKDGSGKVVGEVQGVDVAPLATAEIKMDLTFTVVGKETLTAEIVSEKDQNADNNTSNLLNIEVIEQGSKFVIINCPEEELKDVVVSPVNFMSNETISETIYKAADIDAAGMDLKMIQYQYSKVEKNYPDVNIKVYVTETELDSLTEKTFLPTEMTLVYEGNRPVSTTDSYYTIPFDTPYKYSGKNLVVMVYKNSPNTKSSGVNFKGTYSAAELRSRFDSVWGEGALDLTFPGGMGWGAAKIVPNIEMLFGKPESGVADAVAANDVKVYPNPATEVVFFSETMAKAELVSVAGQVVFAGENVSEINVEALASGVYMLTAEKADGEIVKTKIVKK